MGKSENYNHPAWTTIMSSDFKHIMLSQNAEIKNLNVCSQNIKCLLSVTNVFLNTLIIITRARSNVL